MKLNILKGAGWSAVALLMAMTSCKDSFLEEDGSHMYSDDLMKTEQGALSAAAGLYANIRWHFGYEWAYGITLYGTDEFTNGADLTAEPWNTYDNRLNPMDCTPATGAANKNCPAVSALWTQMYYGISSANNLLARATYVGDEATRNKVLGEAYFLRGYNYYRLFAQYGGVVLQTEPTEGVVRNFERASAEATLNQVISDLEQAYNLLPTTKWRGNGTWTKYTAAHFLAKALLFRQSERCAEFSSKYNKETDLRRVVSLCEEVEAACPLAANYEDLYGNWTGVDCANEGLSEILMACEHNGDSNTKGRYGNRTYNYFAPQFSNFSAGWVQRGQYIGEMDFQRCRPTEYAYEVFDNVNDARMWKTFHTVFGINNAAVADAKVIEDNGITADQVPDLGDEGIVFILNKKDDPRFQDESTFGTFGRGGVKHSFVNPLTGKWVPNVFPVYLGGKYVMNTYGVSGNPAQSNVFCGINKTADGSRDAEKGDAHRDVIMARTGETVLVRAEALVRLGDFGGAISAINKLRARAQWKAGEARDSYVDGTIAFDKDKNTTAASTTPKKNKDKKGTVLNNQQAYNYSNLWKNSYYLSTGIEPTTEASNLQITSFDNLPAEDEAILSELHCSNAQERAINFIMNERTRELLGEWNRWEELSRTGLLITRAKLFNPEAQAITAGKHELRPIPMAFLETLQNSDGSNLTDAQKAAWQNPGY
ncbi:MAG: RagB/SusD family nutrient uptake outer membrane protein [Bacteroidales bacterium]|nr:RagB/SusD family nutrient uptake outer membrane protein [Bacteroidales bacterium]